jgi:glycosyltransferase involved in cell wall biosynthesis
MNRVTYVFRRSSVGRHSIEELFKLIIQQMFGYINIRQHEVPQAKASIIDMFKNIVSIINIKGIIHITGDVHYLGILPFKKTILTVHDVQSILDGGTFKNFFLKLFWFWLPSLFVKKITVISEFSRDELLNIVPWAASKVKVIYNPVNSCLIKTSRKFLEIPTILHLGTNRNKNLINTIKSLVDIPCVLIIVGNLNKNQLETLERYNIQFKNYSNISFLKIKELYENADIVSFISLYEGFGMPIIEAQKVGRVVITSQRGSIPEIAADSVHYVDPLNIIEINKGFKLLINNEQYRDSLIIKGFNNVSRFSLSSIIKQYKQLYREI